MFDLKTLSRHASIAVTTILTHELCVSKEYSFEARLVCTSLVNLALNFAEHIEIIADKLLGISPSQEETNEHHYFMDNIKITKIFFKQRCNFENGFPANHSNHLELKM